MTTAGEGDRDEGDNAPRSLPRYAVVQRGTRQVRGRVLDYQGNGYFTVLLSGDIRLFTHRDRLIFTNR